MSEEMSVDAGVDKDGVVKDKGAARSLRRGVARWSTWWLRLFIAIPGVFIVMRELGVPVPGLPAAIVLAALPCCATSGRPPPGAPR